MENYSVIKRNKRIHSVTWMNLESKYAQWEKQAQKTPRKRQNCGNRNCQLPEAGGGGRGGIDCRGMRRCGGSENSLLLWQLHNSMPSSKLT